MNAQKGMVRPLWLAIGVVTSVVVGTSVNKCFTCGPADRSVATAALPPIDSEPINPIAEPQPEPVAEPWPEPEFDGESEEETGEDPLPGSRGPFDTTPRPLPKLPEAPRPAGLADHTDLTFDFLADYTYEFPEPGQAARDQIPNNIKEFDDKKVAVKGFMIPVRTEGDQVIEFILVRNQMACCYGAVPRMNEWIHVTMAQGRLAPYAVDIPITVFGTLEVGEVYEDGIVMSLYRMRATDVIEPPILR